jgi:hypothetical protein
MGYATRYKLHGQFAETVDPAAVIASFVKSNQDAGFCLTAAGETQEEGTWYDHEADLIALSRRFPWLLFTLEGDGERQGDQWKKYFLGGAVQVERAEIKIGDFDPAKLVTK